MPLATLALVAIATSSPVTQSAAGGPTVFPGAKAPPLAVGGWLKQTAPEPQKGRFRVVEFWATWCGPCHAAMPHLTALARKYRSRLDIVGVSVRENPGTTPAVLKKFVSKMGDKMDYRVAYDTPKGTMATTWLDAARLDGIPATFLLDDAGTILWIGHPNRLEAQLEAAFAGKVNVAGNRDAFLGQANWFEDSKAAIAKAGEAYKAGRKDEAEKIWNETLAKWPRSAFMVRKARLDTYPSDSPESAAIVDAMLAGNPVERETAVKFARSLPRSERERALTIVDRALAGKPDDELLYAGIVTYTRLEAYPKAIRAADLALAQLDERLADPRYEKLYPLIRDNRAKFQKLRDEALEKSRQGL